jgi:arylsulfatase A-like enzyme
MDERWDFAEDDRALLRRLYRSDVSRVDRALGRLVRAFEEAGLLRDGWLVLTSDHGEQLGEVGAWLHGKSLDQREIHVPLLLLGPGRRARVVDETVSLLDLAPTLLELAGVPQPPGFRGHSLAAALRGESLPPAPAIAELFQTTHDAPRHRLAVVSGDQKLVLGYGGQVARLDLSADAGEARPAPSSRAELSRALGEREAWIDLETSPPRPELSEETRERLRALGYATP